MRKPKGAPRDEWLLAIGLQAASFMSDHLATYRREHAIAEAITGHEMSRGQPIRSRPCSYAASYCAAEDVSDRGFGGMGDFGDPDAYAAGAALAMALEE